MARLIEFLYQSGMGLLSATVVAWYTYMSGVIAVKALFFVVNLSFFVLSVIRMKDPRNEKPKRSYFTRCAGASLLALGLQLVAGYNSLVVVVLEWSIMKYWADAEGVALYDIVRKEWDEDWRPGLRRFLQSIGKQKV